METYAYKDLPITPAMIEELIIQLVNGKTAKRDEIVNLILDYHVTNGGRLPEAKDFSRSVKKALSNMQKKGDAVNKSYGYWAIQKNDAPIVETAEIDENVDLDDIPTHTIYGTGSNAVYFYYFSNYKLLAEMQGKKTWPCKIGRTDRDPLIRILSQASTALPERPMVEFIIKTENASQLETLIHSILMSRKRHIKDSPGMEWFETCPEEVIEILNFVNPEILKCS